MYFRYSVVGVFAPSMWPQAFDGGPIDLKFIAESSKPIGDDIVCYAIGGFPVLPLVLLHHFWNNI